VKRIVIGIVATLVVVAAFSACRQYLPKNRFLRPRQSTAANLSTADARRVFNHERHGAVLQEQGITCGDCHRFDAQIDSTDATVAPLLSGAALVPGSGPCHYCHQEGPTHVATAASACTTCHRNLTPLMPANHQIAWQRVHASEASANPVACQNCHRDAFCINCHQNRDSILTFQHERNYLSFHSVDARANPMQCGSCHREDYCLNCHARFIR
jgi:hypothetical protein